MRVAESLTPRGEALRKLVEKYPPPPSYYDEPEWTDE